MTALAEMVAQVERGEMDRESGFALIRIAFPAVPETQVSQLLAQAGDVSARKKTPVIAEPVTVA